MTVNSFNEWDPLQEVIVGRGVPSTLPALDFTFKLFFHDNIYNKPHDEEGWRDGYITRRHAEEHHEDIENFVQLLTDLDISVKRPKLPEKVYKIKTPYWESVVHPALNVRDQCIVIGNTIIETPPTCRWRYFENDYMKHIFLQYMQEGAQWLQCPKPIMLDSSYDLSYVENDREYYEQQQQDDDHYMNCGHEIMFDAANCMRLGTHILMNVTNENQRLGAQWLRNTLGDKYTIWEVPICDNHIDSEFIPLRPGVAIVTMRQLVDILPPPLQKWDLIFIDEIERAYNESQLVGIPHLASPKIDANLFSISPDRVICQPQYYDILSTKLSKYNIECIPCSIRHGNLFAGAHHCITLDINRKGTLENYFQ